MKKEFYEMLATSGTLSTIELQEWGSLLGRTIFRDGVKICEYSKPYVEFADKDNVVKTLKSILYSQTVMKEYRVTFNQWEELKPRISEMNIEFSIFNDGTVRSRQDISDLFSTVGSSFIIPYKENTDFLSDPARINSNMQLKSSTFEYGECDRFEMDIKRIRKKEEYKYRTYLRVRGAREKYDCPEKILDAIEKLASEEQRNDRWTTISVFNYKHAKFTLSVVDTFSDSIIAALDVTVPIAVLARTHYWNDGYDRQPVTVATIIDYDNLDIKSNDSFIKVSDKYPAVYKQQELPNDLKMFIESLMPVIESRDTARIREFLGGYALDKYDINPMYHDDRTEYVGGELHKPDSDIWDALVSAIQAGGYCDSNGFIFPKYEEGLLRYVTRKSVEPHEAGVITDDNVIVRDLPCEKSGVAGRLSKQVVCIDRDFNSDGWCKVRTLNKAIAGYVPADKIFRPDDMRVIVERDATGSWKITGFRTWD